MRQLANLPSAAAARTLADYLLTRKIETRLTPEAGGWAVWVCDEDRLPQARQELAEFERNPADPRFTAAAGQAEVLRDKRRRQEESLQRREERLHRSLRAVTSGRRPLTVALVVVCVLVCFLTKGGSLRSPLIGELLINPVFADQQGQILTPVDMVAITRGQVWRLVTPIFIHFGPWHLLFNMLMLFRLGGMIEARCGWWRLLLLVLAIAIPSNLAQYYLGHMDWEPGRLVLHPSPAFGGMSGVVYGLLGYAWMKARYEPELGLSIDPSTVLYLLVWFFLCASKEFQEFIGPVANMSHGAGLLGGLLIGVAAPVFRSVWRSLRGG
jgi:GlpG protein